MDNSAWDKAIAFTLKMEGGYGIDPSDPGGETNFGISKKAYPNLDIKNLTVDDAREIYWRDYWMPCKCDQLPPSLALATFDAAVNQGTGKAIRILQTALGVAADGVIGPATLAAAHGATLSQIKKALAVRLEEYAKLMAANPKLLVFALNWSYRVISLAGVIFEGERWVL